MDTSFQLGDCCGRKRTIITLTFPYQLPSFYNCGEEHRICATRQESRQLLISGFLNEEDSRVFKIKRLTLTVRNWNIFRLLQDLFMDMADQQKEYHVKRKEVMKDIHEIGSMMKEEYTMTEVLEPIPSIHEKNDLFEKNEKKEKKHYYYYLYKCKLWNFVSYLYESSKENLVSELLIVAIVARPILSISTELLWVKYSNRLENNIKGLITANAYLSTLGGGHFMCKHVGHAKLLAKLQILVAEGLGDLVLASRCRINLAYNCIQGGQFHDAVQIIRKEEEWAITHHDDLMYNVCHAAKVYLRKTWKAAQDSFGGCCNTPTHDNFYRQRIVTSAL